MTTLPSGVITNWEDGKRQMLQSGLLEYSQLFQVFIEVAREAGGALPIPVEVWMDEFANGARPDQFENLITTLRSRNISVIMFLQSVAQIKQIYKKDSWEILMDACSTFLCLGGGRGAYSTHKYMADLLGSATIDKKNDGQSRGNGGSNSVNFDRQGRELMTSEEISRMPSGDCILFLEGERPAYDKKFPKQNMKEFREAKKMGTYQSSVRIEKLENGQYITIKPMGQMIPLNEEQGKYYKKIAEKEETVKIFEITEEEFLQMDFSEESSEISTEMLSQFLIPKIMEKNLEGTIFECLDRYYDQLSVEQKEEILSGLEGGLTEEQVKTYFFLPVKEMEIRRRLLRLTNE